ncbi:hypothetical protein Xseb_13625 [Xanthomonas citri pv. sesbaniae]|uniref:Transposase n=1 Tax=Xanthomonas citri pv. sesbaniae TaxID=473425 RepID=A0AAW4RMI0_XANCI|nr:hypothetical protein [Xanthomonas citri pv. sesbaniae]
MANGIKRPSSMRLSERLETGHLLLADCLVQLTRKFRRIGKQLFQTVNMRLGNSRFVAEVIYHFQSVRTE